MQLYDLLYIISNQFTDLEISSVKEQIEFLLQKNDGNIIKTIEIGRRKLSYPIKQARYGIYFRVFFNLEPINSKKLNKDLRLNSNIIRYQIIKTKPSLIEKSLTKIPSEVKISKEEEKEEEEDKKIAIIKKPKISFDELDEEKLDKILSHE
ncbi:30S ribosomal protein S6 [Candidatus Kuenenbacteria bacterium HGW-Kuenenbacteria-1]|uniref:Small ribosomal subunit protein bS6 n=1 Tax=Candidatus Kuenenbacteria bacterium HGW-Kuenenbacteria-1 TaxID=2013812 RepID=A0A2N1UN12_9BACT|nr:MAG: 30S ribosomal protein S6 [Candidatus Kuenenbacteria bacterium HGW-Kuenenbacteria-1]